MPERTRVRVNDVVVGDADDEEEDADEAKEEDEMLVSIRSH